MPSRLNFVPWVAGSGISSCWPVTGLTIPVHPHHFSPLRSGVRGRPTVPQQLAARLAAAAHCSNSPCPFWGGYILKPHTTRVLYYYLVLLLPSLNPEYYVFPQVSRGRGGGSPESRSENRRNLPNVQLLTVDHSARGSMKTAASCVSVCESQEYQIHRQVERTLRRRHSHVLPSLLHEGRISIHMHRRCLGRGGRAGRVLVLPFFDLGRRPHWGVSPYCSSIRVWAFP